MGLELLLVRLGSPSPEKQQVIVTSFSVSIRFRKVNHFYSIFIFLLLKSKFPFVRVLTCILRRNQFLLNALLTFSIFLSLSLPSTRLKSKE